MVRRGGRLSVGRGRVEGEAEILSERYGSGR